MRKREMWMVYEEFKGMNEWISEIVVDLNEYNEISLK